MRKERIQLLKDGQEETGPVFYWMSRDQRVSDNWALLYAQEIALRKSSGLGVVFCLVPRFLNATIRQYGFMLDGLKEVEANLRDLNIAFFLLEGDPERIIPSFLQQWKASALVADFDPLRIKRRWKDSLVQRLSVPFYEVDAHNIVPCRLASPKMEYGAYTIRPKIQRLLPEFLDSYPRPKRHPVSLDAGERRIDWKGIKTSLAVSRSVREVEWLRPGEKEAHQALGRFLSAGLATYSRDRNDPNRDGQSGLSPYLHFGHLSAQRVVLEVLKVVTSSESRDAFLEEMIVRRELSDNFCFYNNQYDTVAGFPEWAQRTLEEHERDRRPYVYSLDEFEEGRTHDNLWNAAQMEMVKRGKMHGYMRMYWAKKILEWTESPKEAMDIAIYLNDRFELDGRDPNGYAGIAWSIGGVHDRAWNERNVFGKIRYMSYNGCRSKFDVDSYIERINRL